MSAARAIAGTTRVHALIGAPVAHSRSPALHNALFAHCGLDAAYVALPVAPDTTGAALVAAVRTLGLAGANLTVPFKERVLPHLDGQAPSARAAGAVNTLVVENGAIIGHNTDGAGLMDGAREAGWTPGGRAVVLGAGGAGRAVAAALAAAGCAVTVLNRSPARAAALADALGISAGPLSAFAAHAAGASLVVNCCTPAADPVVGALDARGLAPGALWIDTNYFRPAPVPPGPRSQTGAAMLLHQGLRAFALWTGHTVPAATARALVPGFAP